MTGLGVVRLVDTIRRVRRVPAVRRRFNMGRRGSRMNPTHGFHRGRRFRISAASNRASHRRRFRMTGG